MNAYANVVDLVTRRAFTPRPESTEDIVRRKVMERCLNARVPIACARSEANAACQSVRAGHEPSGAVNRAVDRAIKAAFPDNTPPSAA